MKARFRSALASTRPQVGETVSMQRHFQRSVKGPIVIALVLSSSVGVVGMKADAKPSAGSA